MIGHWHLPNAPGRVRFVAIAAAVGLLAGCAVAPKPVVSDRQALADQAARERQLGQREAWALRGRLAVSGNGDGGSGQLQWRQSGHDTTFEVRAPVSRQTWRLLANSAQARLEGLEGGIREGRDAASLVRDEIGWELPIEHLAAWVRGMRGPGRASVEFDRHGLPARIEQHGWQIEYRGWDRAQTPPMPSRVFASRGDHRVRLAIEQWQFGP